MPLGEILGVLNLVWEIVKGAKELVKFIEDNKHEAWFQESAKVFSALRAADTPEKKKELALKLRDLINSATK